MIQFNFSENYILEDDVVLLRPIQLTDYEHLKRKLKTVHPGNCKFKKC